MGLRGSHARLLHLASVVRPSLRIFPWFDIDCDLLSALPLRMHALQKWNAPVAPRAGTLAEGQLARDSRAFTLQEGREFPQADAETEADMIILLHPQSLGHWTQLQSLNAPIRNAEGTDHMTTAIPPIIPFMLWRECQPRIHDADKGEHTRSFHCRHR